MTRRRAAHRTAERRRHSARCDVCKARFTPSRAGHVHCSARCRMHALRARQRAQVGELPALVLLPRRTAAACEYCRATFKRSNARQRFCSSSCRSRMSEARRAAVLVVLTRAYDMPAHKAADVLDERGLAAVRAAVERAGWQFDAAARRFTRTDLGELAV
jgi:predicted nucleic acid-binding Zn ribbon protein